VSELRRQCFIGIDVGGTKIAAAAVDPIDGSLAHRREIPTRAERDASQVLEDIARLAELVAADVQSNGGDVESIGIGVPEIVDAQGHIRSAYLLDWTAFPLAERLVGAMPASPGGPAGHGIVEISPVVFTSDVRAAALAEATFGVGGPYRLFVYVSVGTGISSTLVQDGVPLAGARGGAVVLSTAPVSVPCRDCGEWSEFVLEDYASGAALARRYASSTGTDVATAEAVIAAANAGEPAATEVIDSAARALGSAIGWLVNIIDPEAVVIGGGLGLAPGRFHDRLVAATREHVWNPAARDLPILPAALGADAGLIGAALSVQCQTHALGSPHLVLHGERR
jgi:glucokinase